MASYDPKTALIAVDIQNDFADPKGSLYVREGEKVVDVANREADRARAAGALLVYTQDWHPEVTPHFKKFGGVWPVHCVRETWGAQPPPRLKVDGEILRKGTGGEDGYSGFTAHDLSTDTDIPTGLEELLRQRGVARVVVCGLATNICCFFAARDLRQAGFNVFLVEDAGAGIDVPAAGLFQDQAKKEGKEYLTTLGELAAFFKAREPQDPPGGRPPA